MAEQERKTPVDESEQSHNTMSSSQQVTAPESAISSPRADSDSTPKSPTPQSITSSPPQQTTEQVANQQPQETQQEGIPEPRAMSESVRTLKEAFPETDVEVIEAILESQSNSVERSFEVLLGMSDPNYKPEEPPRPQQTVDNSQDDAPPPVMPPRPTSDRQATEAPYGYWQQTQPQQQPQEQQQQQQQPQEPRSVEEQMRLDEEFARQLALQDERDRVQQYRQRQQQQQQEDDQPLFNFQEDLPVIKEKVIEAGNAAKKKVMELYSQFKASREQPNTQGQGSSIPTTNAQYRGLPSDEGDDLLAGDVSALRLSDNDVYAQTRPARGQQGGVIHVNPPISGQNKSLSVDDQIRADEELARRLAQEDQFWESSRETATPQMPPRRPTPTPGSPISGTDLEGESVTLSAMPSTQTPPLQKKPDDRTEERRSYVIRDEDDSDDDDLVDVDTEDLEKKDEKPHEKQINSPH